MRHLIFVVLLALPPALVNAQDERGICPAIGDLVKSSVDLTVEQALLANSMRVTASLWFDVSDQRKEELQAFLNALIEKQNAEMDKTIESAKHLLELCQQK